MVRGGHRPLTHPRGGFDGDRRRSGLIDHPRAWGTGRTVAAEMFGGHDRPRGVQAARRSQRSSPRCSRLR